MLGNILPRASLRVTHRSGVYLQDVTRENFRISFEADTVPSLPAARAEVAELGMERNFYHHLDIFSQQGPPLTLRHSTI
jgi:hypothetical protein